MLGSDTAKRDITLAVIGFLIAGFFYYFYSSVHPLSSADSSLGKDLAAQEVASHLTRLGFLPSAEHYTAFRADSDILNLIQKQNSSEESERDSLLRNAPAFYWYANQKLTVDERSAALMNGEPGVENAELRISETGDLLALHNPSAVFPSRVLEEAFYENFKPSLISSFQQFRADPEIFEKFKFRFTDDSDFRFEQETDLTILTADDARQLADFHLERTGWPADIFSFEEMDLIVNHGVEIARVTYSGSGAGSIDLHFDILPTGALINLEYDFTDNSIVDDAWTEIRFGAVSISILIFAIWVLILLFSRIRLRLIDTKLAVLIAVLAGFMFPVMFLFEWIYSFLYTFEEFAIRESFGRLFGLGFLAAIGSLFYFSSTAVGDSITRDNWSEKLRTFDLLRIGRLSNRPVGLVFVRAVIYSYILVGGFGFLFYLIPDSYLTVSESFRSDRTIFPSLSILMLSGLIFLFCVQCILLIINGKLRSYTKNGLWIILLTAIIFALIGVLPINIGPWPADMMIAGILGLGIGWIYLKEDFLTIFLALFLFGIHLMGAPGWVMENSPDASLFYVSLLITVAFLGLGSYGLYKGEPIDQLPQYVPDYINDLKKDERIKQELQIARIVQKSFLPEKMPLSNGFEFAAICKPAYETGGDYYDFIEIDDNQLAITIGDVSGKGIEAAFYMTFTKGVLHALCTESKSTLEILSKINSLFIKNARKGTFISLIFGIIDYEKNLFKFSRGGHNPLLHYCAESGRVREYKPSGIGLGMARDDVFRKYISETDIRLKEGDLIILYTDGVVEATNGSGKFYGEQRLHSIIKRNSRLSAENVLKAITKDLHEFGEGSDLHDDMTAVVIKKK